AGDGPKDKQDVQLFLAEALRIRHWVMAQNGSRSRWDLGPLRRWSPSSKETVKQAADRSNFSGL
ncbi:MAG: hypothetical protein WAK57_02965, partial [Desulfobacterales bacterium]